MYQFVSNSTNISNLNLQNIDLDDFKLYDDVYSKLKIVLSNFKLTIPEDTCKKLLKFLVVMIEHLDFYYLNHI